MSITNGQSEPVNDEGKRRGGLLIESVTTLIRALGLSDTASDLSKHVAQKEHEDMPSNHPLGALSTPPTVDGVLPTVARDFASKCPPRLRALVPPTNFGAVVPGSVFRSSYPLEENFDFLKTLKLKTILTLVPEPIPDANLAFMKENGIQHFQVHIPANKGEISIPTCQMTKALGVVLDRSNHPILIHCNKGKHRTGCVVGCIQTNIFAGEELHNVFDEYHTYADPKARILDECFMEIFDGRTVLWMARRYNWIPLPAPESNAPTSPVPTLGVVRPRA
ncbi:tyrosine-protein phosphatase-like protein SIW14 [Clohesyomyces aquaticus]|uniref:diphosphoinositol-polyphosphate diphosphatase n=1 Tax=Clohesyomyces aquaticus TaxID=1231657 RepID=A0A1Y1ZQE5_9PLEO|nr:tyrosine-protein phosphatase-like protein SIW14 [Clohesyomyces aquaticus]